MWSCEVAPFCSSPCVRCDDDCYDDVDDSQDDDDADDDGNDDDDDPPNLYHRGSGLRHRLCWVLLFCRPVDIAMLAPCLVAGYSLVIFRSSPCLHIDDEGYDDDDDKDLDDDVGDDDDDDDPTPSPQPPRTPPQPLQHLFVSSPRDHREARSL